MSIENFCMIYPPDGDIRVLVENIKKTTERQNSRSLVVVLAEQLAKEGRDGIRELIDKLSGSDTMFKLDQQSYQRLPVQDKRNVNKNYEAIVCGNVIMSIERTLASGEYDHEDFCERYNLATNSLRLDDIAEAVTKKREKLSKEQMSKMYSVAGGDKTLAGFLEGEGVLALPSTLREFFESRGGLLRAIREDILPIYKPRAKFLVA